MSPSRTGRSVGGKRRVAAALAIAATLWTAGAARAEEPAATALAATTKSDAQASAPPATESPGITIAGPVRDHRAHKPGIPPTAFNPKANKVKWDESWPKFRTAELVVTGVAGVAVFGALAIPPQPDTWRQKNDFDEGARDLFRAPTEAGRHAANDVSDVMLALMVNQLVVDATLVAWWGHDRPSVAYQMVLMDLEALALSGGIQAIVSGAVSRWRPFGRTCVGPEDEQSRDCRTNKQYRSFFSGHTSGAFTVAGLMCMHHAYLPIYGGGIREKLTCAASFAAAATVGMLRMGADMHFASDVLVGAAIGTMSGLGVPYFLHYRGGAPMDAASLARPEKGGVSFRITPTPMGLTASGEF
jgi:hypothetical protein